MARVMVVHRDYRLRGGEDSFLDEQLLPTLSHLGHEIVLLRFPTLAPLSRLSAILEVFFMLLGAEKFRPSFRQFKRMFERTRPNVVILNNFMPTVSLAIPKEVRRGNSRSIAWSHNARLICANGLTFDGKRPCTACLDIGSGSIFGKSCFESRLQSIIYAAIYRNRRVTRTVASFVDTWVASSNYSAKTLSKANFIAKTPLRTKIVRMDVPSSASISNKEPLASERVATLIRSLDGQDFFLFVGRLSHEKGADRVIELAKKHPNARFVLAGTGPLESTLKQNAPSNATFLGYISNNERQALFAYAKALLVCSRVPENSPVILFESHPSLVPVVYETGGGAEETVRWLERDGCAWENFDPKQNLERRGKPLKRNAFAQALGKLLTEHLNDRQ